MSLFWFKFRVSDSTAPRGAKHGGQELMLPADNATSRPPTADAPFQLRWVQVRAASLFFTRGLRWGAAEHGDMSYGCVEPDTALRLTETRSLRSRITAYRQESLSMRHRKHACDVCLLCAAGVRHVPTDRSCGDRRCTGRLLETSPVICTQHCGATSPQARTQVRISNMLPTAAVASDPLVVQQ